MIKIQVSLLGTPAEEEHGGKIDFIKAGVFKDVDAAMMAHPAPVSYTHLTLPTICSV